jgi:hypothetical protein
MIRGMRVLTGLAAAVALAGLAGCESGNYGGSVSVGYGGSYYPGGYYPGYYPGYGCCWDDPDYIVVNPPDRPNERPDRPTTLPAGPGEMPVTRPTTKPTPAPRPMGGGGRRR